MTAHERLEFRFCMLAVFIWTFGITLALNWRFS
jgi:hypothetical protein